MSHQLPWKVGIIVATTTNLHADAAVLPPANRQIKIRLTFMLRTCVFDLSVLCKSVSAWFGRSFMGHANRTASWALTKPKHN